MKRDYKNPVEVAQLRGSSATTISGAKRYLLPHLSNDLPLSPRVIYSRKKPYQDECYEQRAQHCCVRFGVWLRDDAEALAAELSKKDWHRAQEAITRAYPYRRARSHWADGEHSVTVGFADPTPNAVCYTEGVWSYSGKWRGNNSRARFDITRRALALFPDGMAAGLVVLDAERLGPREYSMVWVQQGRGFSLDLVRGFYICGCHVRALSLAAARRAAAKMRRLAAQVEFKNRAIRRKEREDAKAYARKCKQTYVVREDSLSAGNCSAATDEFARQAARAIGAPENPGAFALRADVLLSMRDDVYTRRAVMRAMQR